MADVFPYPIELPRLSAEALALIQRRDDDPVDLRQFIALPGDYRPEILRAALAWNVPPETVLR